MKSTSISTIAAISVATIVVSFSLCSCSGRKMSNMQPRGETVEVVIQDLDSLSPHAAGSSLSDSIVDAPANL